MPDDAARLGEGARGVGARGARRVHHEGDAQVAARGFERGARRRLVRAGGDRSSPTIRTEEPA